MISDVLYDAAREIRDYLSPEQDGPYVYGDLAPEILRMVEQMDALRIKIEGGPAHEIERLRKVPT